MDKLFILFQYLVPQHLLSRLMGWVGRTSISWIKNPFSRWFVKNYNINMAEALEEDPTAYACFNDFFTRALKDGARPIDPEPHHIVSPADGAISQLGDISHGRIFQAKGQSFSAQELLGGDEALAEEFAEGKFATVYLSPKDYHRVHMPYGGKLRSMIHVPGDLFSVNDTTAANVPRLFARNERAVCIFDTDIGPMAVVLVGAMIVASIETVWAGQVAPVRKQVVTTHYGQPEKTWDFAKGDEMGRFKLGSTAVVLFPKDSIEWLPEFESGTATVMGQVFAKKTDKP